MLKKVFIAGLLGGLTLLIWTFIVNGLFWFRHNIDMKQVANEPQVYEVLKGNIPEPGRYICNPSLTAEGTFQLDEPVYSILYGGMGHEAAGGQQVIELILSFLIATVGAWLLSMASERVIKSYFRKVLFFTVIGLLIALFTDINSFGIGSYPLGDSVILALHDIIMWTVLGVVISLVIKPVKT